MISKVRNKGQENTLKDFINTTDKLFDYTRNALVGQLNLRSDFDHSTCNR